MAAILGAIIGIIFFIWAMGSFCGDIGNAYSDGGCAGVISFLFFAFALVVLVFVFGL